MSVYVHPTAEVAEEASIGADTSIWNQSQVRAGATIGRGCIISKGVYIDSATVIGDHVKIQNYVSVYHGVTIEDGVFVGPHVCFTNDFRPRAVNPDGTRKTAADWTVTPTLVRAGASIGANATIVCGITIGRWAMIGAGSVVTRDVPDYGLVRGNPARLSGFVCSCGALLNASATASPADAQLVELDCSECQQRTAIARESYAQYRKQSDDSNLKTMD